MYEPDKEKTTFVINRDTYYYKVMPFGLKNVEVIYQRLVNMMFEKQIGVTMEVYIDNIMMKGKQRSNHIGNLAKTFDIHIKYKMKLNVAKCTFGVSSGIFLGYLVTQQGIEAHPKKIGAIPEVKSLTTLKEIQSLARRAAVLNRFLSQSFLKAIKKAQ
ncbi:hypothetical protein ACFX1R_026171 [Malus domestica]